MKLSKINMRSFVIFQFGVGCIIFISCKNASMAPGVDTTADKKHIIGMLDSLNMAAAKADFNAYFNFYSDDAIFTGTDATERWDKKSFMAYAKPYFDKGRAWSFKSIQRNIYIDKSGSLAWFDELLNTQMKICRGSGVLVKQANEWKLQQYVLSMTIPNNDVDTIIKIKSSFEDSIINTLEKK
jgi:hypothetical protein